MLSASIGAGVASDVLLNRSGLSSILSLWCESVFPSLASGSGGWASAACGPACRRPAVSAVLRSGLGPSCLARAVISLARWANSGPAEAGTWKNSSRSGSSPISASRCLAWADGADRPQVALQEVAIAQVAAGHVDGVGPVLEGPQQQHGVDLAGAEDLHHPHVRRVLQPHRPGQVAGRVGAVGAAEGDDLGFVGFDVGLLTRAQLSVSPRRTSAHFAAQARLELGVAEQHVDLGRRSGRRGSGA